MTFKHRDATNTGIDIAKGRVDTLDAQIITDALNCKTGPKTFADIGSGESRLSAVMALLGWRVYAYDKRNLKKYFATLGELIGQDGGVLFTECDLLKELPILPTHLRIAVLQRSLHYLPYTRAQELLAHIHKSLVPKGKLYMTVSSLKSAFARDYPCGKSPVSKRFCTPRGDVATTYSAQSNMCLYTEEELTALLESSGYAIVHKETTRFGNMRIIAEKANIA